MAKTKIDPATLKLAGKHGRYSVYTSETYSEVRDSKGAVLHRERGLNSATKAEEYAIKLERLIPVTH